MGIDFDTLRFAAPQYLWLLVAPGVLLVGWFWQLAARRREVSFQLGRKNLNALSSALSMLSIITWPNCVALRRSAS